MTDSQSLYIKYRPRLFKEVIGHADIARSLQAALKKETNHTFLLTGPSGLGKTTFARLAAATLNATVQEIDAATFTGIDDMREITKTLAYRPLNADIKVIIVDECHALSKSAWQSLLKSLEEPPAWLYWFLCTTDMAKVPENIKTRCTAYSLKPLPVADIIELLEWVAGEEAVLADELGGQILRLCAKEASGSPRQALVNMGACLTAKSREEAASLLMSVGESAEANELAALLLKGAGWDQLKDILEILKEQNPESVRHVVRAYVTKAILSTKKKPPEKWFAVLEAFSTSFSSSDGMSPLVLALGGLTLNSDGMKS